MTNITDCNRTANKQLADSNWAVRIGRSMIDNYCNPDDFGALIALAAVLAWRDRGPGWLLDGERTSAQRPPGGWAPLLGVTRHTWISWRDRAIDLRLLSKSNGEYAGGGLVPLLRPIEAVQMREHETEAREVPAEQFARIPAAALFDPKLSRTAKRVLVGLCLYRKPNGLARVAVPTIAKRAGLNERNARLGLRQLERAGAIKANGLFAKVRTYKIVEPKVNASVQSETPHCALRDPPSVQSETPLRAVGDPPAVQSETPYQESYQEKPSSEKHQEKVSGAEGRRPPQMDLALMRLLPGRKDVRQESGAIVEPTPTPERCRERIATLEATLSTMNHCTPGWSTLTKHRNEYLAALSPDTELRASA